MENNNDIKKNNKLGKIAAIIFICIVIIIASTFLVCMLESKGSMDESSDGAIWWLLVMAIWVTGIPFIISGVLSLISVLRYLRDKKNGIKIEKTSKIINIINIINIVVWVIIIIRILLLYLGMTFTIRNTYYV